MNSKTRQDAMTSKQVMPTLIVALLLLGGCDSPKRGADPLVGPYPARRVWAIVPLRNESGSLEVNSDVLADHFVRQLQNATNIDVLAVNRTLEAMEGLHMDAVKSVSDAMKLMATLDADGLVVGTITAYDPYDPPKIGITVELYQSPRLERERTLDTRKLMDATTEAAPSPANRAHQPVSVVSGFFDAADADVRHQMQRYAYDRGATNKKDSQLFENPLEGPDPDWRLYRISTDLYCEFVTYVMSWRLLHAESIRLAPPPATQPAR